MGFHERLRCPACDSGRGTTLIDVPLEASPVREYLQGYYKKLDWSVLDGGHYHARECSRCGCIFQANVPDESVLATVYGDWLVPDEPEAMVKRIPAIERDPSLSKAAHELMALSHQIGFELRGANVLDYGFGWGEWLEVAISLGANAYGTEVGSVKRRHGSSLGIEVIGDGEIAEYRFDLVRAEQVFEHLVDPMSLLHRLSPQLKTGGAVYISVPRDDRLARRLADPEQWRGVGESPLPIHDTGSAPINALEPLEHLNCFTQAALEHMARRANLLHTHLRTRSRYTFLNQGARLASGGPRRLVKSIARPVYELFRRSNQTCLMLKSDA